MDKNITRWAIGTVVVPLLIALLSVFSVQVKDALFPTPPPELENRITASLEKRLIVLEAKLSTLTKILHVQPMPLEVASNDNHITDSELFKQKIEVKNNSQYSGRKLFVGKKAWDWTIYINSDLSTLNKISCVTYQLHPTFRDPIQRICEQGKTDKAFSYSATGWGTFNVEVKIEFKDGSKLTTEHFLIFQEQDA